LIFAR